MATDVYRVYAYDLNTNALITELPGSGLAFDSRLNDAGSISMSLPISRPSVASRVKPLMAYSGIPFAVYVDRDGMLVWGGIIWTWTYSRASGVVELGGKEFLSYFSQRTIVADYSLATYPSTDLTVYATAPTSTLTVTSTTGFTAGMKITVGSDTPEVVTILSVTAPNTITLVSPTVLNHPSTAPVSYSIDPAQLAYKALTDAQNVALAGTGSNIGVTVSGGTSSITPIVPGYALSQRTMVSNVVKDMSNISEMTNGTVDTVFKCAWSSGVPTKTATIYSPRAGVIGSASGIAFDLSRVMDYTWPTDASSIGSKIFSTGGSGLSAEANSASPIGGSGQMPRMDKVVSFSNVNSQTQLDAMTQGLPQQFGAPIPTPTVTEPTSAYPVLGSFSVGDDARLYIASDERFPAGLNEYWRIIQYSVSVPDEGVPTITFTFNQPPVY